MNFSDSIKNVLKKKSKSIFTDFWEYDLKEILLTVPRDVKDLVVAGRSSVLELKKNGFKVQLKEMVESGADTLLIFKVLPKRMKKGFSYFREDFLEELERQPDQKQRNIFAVKVIGALAKFAVRGVYKIRKGQVDFSVKGLKRRNVFTKVLMAEVVFKITQHFMYRLLSEVEQGLTEAEDLKKIRYFKDLIASRSLKEIVDDDGESDEAIQIVENFKNYIRTGKREYEESADDNQVE